MFQRTAIRLRTLRYLAPIFLKHLRALWRGYKHWRVDRDWSRQPGPTASYQPDNPLLKYFNEHKKGPGIWKFNHYFEIYERHFARFRGQEVHVLEIGIYSGGSLEMWREYFGPRIVFH